MHHLRHSLLKRLHWWFWIVAVSDLLWALFLSLASLVSWPDNPSYSTDPVRVSMGWILLVCTGLFAVANGIAAHHAARLRQPKFLVAVAYIDLIVPLHLWCPMGLLVGSVALFALLGRRSREAFHAVAAGLPRETALKRMLRPLQCTAADELDVATTDWDQAPRSDNSRRPPT